MAPNVRQMVSVHICAKCIFGTIQVWGLQDVSDVHSLLWQKKENNLQKQGSGTLMAEMSTEHYFGDEIYATLLGEDYYCRY